MGVVVDKPTLASHEQEWYYECARSCGGDGCSQPTASVNLMENIKLVFYNISHEVLLSTRIFKEHRLIITPIVPSQLLIGR